MRTFIGRKMLAIIYERDTSFEKMHFVYCIFTAALKIGSDDDELFLRVRRVHFGGQSYKSN